MLGEAALFPDGFHSWPCNTRVSSLMSPTIALNKSGRAVIVTGSGGAVEYCGYYAVHSLHVRL